MNHCPALISPAYYFEHLAFTQKPKGLLGEIVPRIIALAAPLLYALQFLAYSTVAIIDLILTIRQITSGACFLHAYVHATYSIRNCLSSFLEIPEKMVYGSHRTPNYCKDAFRYIRKDLSEYIPLP